MKLVIRCMVFFLLSGTAYADDFASTRAKLESAVASDVRTEAEKARDRNRQPIATLEFYGLRDDMRVVELIPGGGWYTKLLAPVLRDEGELFVGIGADRAMQRLGELDGFDEVKVVAQDASIDRPEGSRLYNLSVGNIGVDDVDIVFTFRNYHNFSASGRAAMNDAAYAALKPGGVYAVVDHTRRHMEADSGENRRRIDPVLAIQEIQAAGFVFEDFSDLHFRADDELRYEVGRRTVTGNTDRWTLKFRKPQ
ncbi:MAG: methyltransferase [Pseudomonadota bacterium]